MCDRWSKKRHEAASHLNIVLENDYMFHHGTHYPHPRKSPENYSNNDYSLFKSLNLLEWKTKQNVFDAFHSLVIKMFK